MASRSRFPLTTLELKCATTFGALTVRERFNVFVQLRRAELRARRRQLEPLPDALDRQPGVLRRADRQDS